MLYWAYNEKQKYLAQNNAYDESSPTNVILEAYDPATDKIRVQTTKAETTIPCYHPAVYGSSWIRCTPEMGTTLITKTASNQYVAIGTDAPKREERITEYNNNNDLYRPLRGGEIELHSAGLAQIYMSKNTYMELSVGPVRTWYDFQQLEYGIKTPLLKITNADVVYGELHDEIRFGYVSRSLDNIKLKNTFVKLSDETTYAKEYCRIFTNNLQTLEDYRVGNVIDDSGNTVKSDENIPLRMQHIYYTSPTESVTLQIDENGTTKLEFPTTTKYLSINNKGEDIKIKTKKNLIIDIEEENMKVNVKQNIQYQCKEYRIGAADNVAVLGNELKTLFTELIQLLMTHTHIGNLGAPTALSPNVVTQLNTILNNYINNNAILSDFIKISKTSGT